MSTPRIDTLLNTIDSVQTYLTEIRPHLVDMHGLAIQRSRTAPGERTHGGDRDYALDNVGDPRARDLYVSVAVGLVHLGQALESDLKATKGYLNQQGRTLRRDGSADVTSDEHLSARFAQARRNQQGQRSPHPLVSQPERKGYVDPVMELDALQAAVRRLAKHLDREHGDCTKPDSTRRRVRWYDRSVMSPAQRDAFDRALIGEREQATA